MWCVKRLALDAEGALLSSKGTAASLFLKSVTPKLSSEAMIQTVRTPVPSVAANLADRLRLKAITPPTSILEKTPHRDYLGFVNE